MKLLQQMEQTFLKAVFSAMTDMVFIFDSENRYIYYHAPSDNNLYTSPEMFIGKRVSQVLPEDQAVVFENALSRAAAGESVTIEYRLKIKEKEKWFSAVVSPVFEDESIQGAVAVVRDITVHKESLDKLLLAGIVFESTIEGICITDSAGRIQLVNPAFMKITGYTQEEVLGKNPRILKSDRHSDEFYHDMWNDAITKGSWQGEVWNRRKGGEVYPEFLSINSVKDKTGEVKYYIAVFTDSSEIKVREELLYHQAYHDPLTNLPNRDLLRDRVRVSLMQMHRKESSFAVIYFNIDNFRHINNTLGHLAGDHLLQLVAERLKGCVREGDTVARISADVFVLHLVPPTITGMIDVIAVIKRIYEVIHQHFMCDGHELFITCCLGIAIYPNDGTDETTILKNAEIAMHNARKREKNSYLFYSSEMNVELFRRFRLENDFRQAINQKQLKVYYQPIIRCDNGTIAGAEALVRWDNPNAGIIYPSDFISLAEENGMISSITESVLGQVYEHSRILDSRGFGDLNIAVNISARDFRDGFILNLVEKLSDCMPSVFLTLEMTEYSLYRHRKTIIEHMNKLKACGIKFSIDDFGTGYSSLSYLKQFPADKLKIDRSFVTDLPHDNDSRVITNAIINLARSLNMKIVAEGVETASQYQCLKELGCDYMQGFYFSKAVPFDEYCELLALGKSY